MIETTIICDQCGKREVLRNPRYMLTEPNDGPSLHFCSKECLYRHVSGETDSAVVAQEPKEHRYDSAIHEMYRITKIRRGTKRDKVTPCWKIHGDDPKYRKYGTFAEDDVLDAIGVSSDVEIGFTFVPATEMYAVGMQPDPGKDYMPKVLWIES